MDLLKSFHSSKVEFHYPPPQPKKKKEIPTLFIWKWAFSLAVAHCDCWPGKIRFSFAPIAFVCSGHRGVAPGRGGGWRSFGGFSMVVQCTRPLASRNLLQMEAKSGIAAGEFDATTTSGACQHPVWGKVHRSYIYIYNELCKPRTYMYINSIASCVACTFNCIS